MHSVSIQQAKNEFDKLVSSVLEGEEIVLTDHKKPVVKMTPIGSVPPSSPKFGSAKGKIRMADDFNATPPDFEDYT
jgi:prevent-host-death family protein